jgi:hypothetical protein
LAILGLELRPFTLSHSTSPIFVKGFFEIESCRTICPGWLQTGILLISASWVARITGVSHQRPALKHSSLVQYFFGRSGVWLPSFPNPKFLDKGLLAWIWKF